MTRTIEDIARENDMPPWIAAEAMVRLMKRGLVAPPADSHARRPYRLAGTHVSPAAEHGRRQAQHEGACPMNTPWNGIPQDPAHSGWHWVGNADRMWPCEWWPITQTWGAPGIGIPAANYAIFEYLGPCQPPVTRCRDGSPRVAVSAEFRPELDQVYIRMNDGTGHYIDGWYWHNDKPVIDIVGKTIPEINAAADEYRRPKQEE